MCSCDDGCRRYVSMYVHSAHWALCCVWPAPTRTRHTSHAHTAFTPRPTRTHTSRRPPYLSLAAHLRVLHLPQTIVKHVPTHTMPIRTQMYTYPGVCCTHQRELPGFTNCSWQLRDIRTNCMLMHDLLNDLKYTHTSHHYLV